MLSPVPMARYNRSHPYEEYTPRFSPPSAHNSSHNLRYNFEDWRYNHNNNDHIHSDVDGYRKGSDWRYNHNHRDHFNSDVDGPLRRSWNEDDSYVATDYYYRSATTSHYRGSLSTVRLENRVPFSNQTKHHNLNRYPACETSNLSAPHSRLSEYSSSRLHKTKSSSWYHLEKDQESNYYLGLNLNRDEHRVRRQDHLEESRFNSRIKDPGSDHYYVHERNDHDTNNALEKDSNKNSKQYKNIITCLICSEEVKRRDIKGHLLFGYVECQSCQWSTKNCKQFSERHTNRYLCSHRNLHWTFPSAKQLKETRDGKTKESLKDYLASTIALKYYAPFDLAYDHFQALVNEMPDDECEKIRTIMKVNFGENRCDDTSSDMAIKSKIHTLINVDLKDNRSVDTFSDAAHGLESTDCRDSNLDEKCNTSDESPDSVGKSLEEMIQFRQVPEPHVVLDDCIRTKTDIELVSPRRNKLNSTSKTYAKKEYFDSSSSSRMPKKKEQSAKIVSVQNKHRTLIIGAPKEIDQSANGKTVQQVSTNEGCTPKHRDILPPSVDGEYVLTYTLSDDCPKCYDPLNPSKLTFCLKTGIIVARCEECDLFICFRNKLTEK